MADWVGLDGMSTAGRYHLMATRQLHGVSPSYEAICLGVADDPELLAHLDGLPGEKRQPNLLLAAVRMLAGPTDTYPAFRSFVLSGWDEVSATMLARRTQTNEPGRCATLLPVLASLPQPLALLEVGASAGLCLYPDRYAYRYDDRAVLGSSPLVLDCAVTGPAPLPVTLPSVLWRGGLDLNPLDVCDEHDVRWLEALVWPEQAARFLTLRAAVELARVDPPTIRRGDLNTDLASLAAEAPTQATLVIFHSAVLAYVPQQQRDRFRAAIDEIARERRTVWISNEGPGVVVDIAPPPGPTPFVLARDGVPLAWTGPHGHRLDWLGAA